MKMKKIITFLSIILLTLFFLQSCQIEKRHYRPGYNIDWFKKNYVGNIHKIKQSSESKNIQQINNDNNTNHESDLYASTNKEITVFSAYKTLINFISNNDSCDEIILKSGEVIKAKVLEIGLQE